jgi:cyanate permease
MASNLVGLTNHSLAQKKNHDVWVIVAVCKLQLGGVLGTLSCSLSLLLLVSMLLSVAN